MIRVEVQHERITTLSRRNRQAAAAYLALFSGGGYRPTPPNPNVVPYLFPAFEDQRREDEYVRFGRVSIPLSLFVVPDTVAVPLVTGIDAQAALSLLANVSLSGTVTPQDLPLGFGYNVVATQSIPAGTPVGQGTIVNLTVQDLTVIPEVEGLTQAAAQAAISAAFLASIIVTKVSIPPLGVVIDQSPDSGAGVPANTVVTLTVSIDGDGFRCQAVTAGWYNDEFRNPGDVFDILQASDFSDYTLNYEIAGGEYNVGWMKQVPQSTPLTQDDGSGFLVTYDPNRRFVE